MQSADQLILGTWNCESGENPVFDMTFSGQHTFRKDKRSEIQSDVTMAAPSGEISMTRDDIYTYQIEGDVITTVAEKVDITIVEMKGHFDTLPDTDEEAEAFIESELAKGPPESNYIVELTDRVLILKSTRYGIETNCTRRD